MPTQPATIELRGHAPGDEMNIARRVPTLIDGGGIDAGTFTQSRLDLAEFHAQAPQLDLAIDPPEAIEVSRRQITREVARPIKPPVI